MKKRKRCKHCKHPVTKDGPRHYKSCRYYIDSEEDQNCVFVAIEKNGPMTLRQIAKVENISHVRVRDIQNKAIDKLMHVIKKEEYI